MNRNGPLAGLPSATSKHSRRHPRPTFAADGGPDQLGAVVDAVREDARPVHVLQRRVVRVAALSDAIDCLDVHECCTILSSELLCVRACHLTVRLQQGAMRHSVGRGQTFGQYDGKYGPRTLLLMKRIYSYCDVSTCDGPHRISGRMKQWLRAAVVMMV